MHGSYQIGRYRLDIKDFQWDVAPLPKGPAGRTVLISGNPSHGLAAAGKNKDRAWEFLRWWITKQNAKLMVLPGNTPTKLSASKEWTEEQKKEAAPKSIAVITEGAQKYGKRAETGIRQAEWNKVLSDTRSAIDARRVPSRDPPRRDSGKRRGRLTATSKARSLWVQADSSGHLFRYKETNHGYAA